MKIRVALGRGQTPEDIGHLAVFLASEEAKTSPARPSTCMAGS
jgi:hypothetical protein